MLLPLWVSLQYRCSFLKADPSTHHFKNWFDDKLNPLIYSSPSIFPPSFPSPISASPRLLSPSFPPPSPSPHLYLNSFSFHPHFHPSPSLISASPPQLSTLYPLFLFLPDSDVNLKFKLLVGIWKMNWASRPIKSRLAQCNYIGTMGCGSLLQFKSFQSISPSILLPPPSSLSSPSPLSEIY